MAMAKPNCLSENKELFALQSAEYSEGQSEELGFHGVMILP